MNTWNCVARRVGLAASMLAGALLTVGIPESAARADVPPPTPTPHPLSAPRNLHASGLEERMRLLTAELGLDAQQQSDVRRLLLEQREQMKRIWSDTSIPPAYRVNATRAIGDKTADRIRALLNEEQKAKYVAARKPREPQSSDSKRSVEDWMNAATKK